MNVEEKISLDALRALAEANADVARPDGFELHADVCATLLARERARGRDAVVTVDVGRAHHAPYRGNWWNGSWTSARASIRADDGGRGDRVHGASPDRSIGGRRQPDRTGRSP